MSVVKNVVLIVFDSLRKDCIGAYGRPPWGEVHTPHFNKLAGESVVMTRAYPESLPTLPTRRALYTGRRVYPFDKGDFRLRGDFPGSPGWGPIPEDQDTLAEMLQKAGVRTALIADVYHMFKPSKNYWRGFDQWMFLRGQEIDPQRSGPRLTRKEIDYYLPREMQTERRVAFIQQCVMNMHGRTREEDYFAPRVLKEAALWLEQNRDAERFFLTVESFDPHEPWLPPAHYRKMYLKEEWKNTREQILSIYGSTSKMDRALLRRTQANYSGVVTMCDRWFGSLIETMRVLGRLEDTMIVFTADHGHSIGDRSFMGKRGYPSAPEVFDVPLMVRFPNARHAGKHSDLLVNHTDITATILKTFGVKPAQKLDGRPFLTRALGGGKPIREHVTIGWGATVTVLKDHWWFNCKVNGTGTLLYDLKAKKPFARNVAGKHRKVATELFDRAVADAGGSFPAWIIELAEKEADAPGCSALAPRK